MTAAALGLEMLRVLALWLVCSCVFGVIWIIARSSTTPDPEARELAPRWIPQMDPRPTVHHERYLRGYWTPDGRLTTLAGAPQITGHMAFTDAELLAARRGAGSKPATDDRTLAAREATVTAIAYLTKKDRTKADRACLRMAARLN